MTFQSVEFLLFFILVFILYWTLCKRSRLLQNALIVLASLIFYGYWDWKLLGLLLITAFSTYFAGSLMSKASKEYVRKTISVSTIVLNLGILFYFKYFNFFVESFIDAFSLLGIRLNTSTLNIILPVGISFYTFSALSYSLDVYSRKIEPTKDIIAYLAYVTFFPSILSGPISRANKQLPQYFKRRDFVYADAVEACIMILWGAIMKLCLADRLGIYVDAVYANVQQHTGTTLLFTSVMYTLQIYADFAGYSLMAIGFGKLLGINLQENFIRPYFAKTLTDFWRRWHISLTTWFRDYIYFPLGGNRCSKGRWVFNTMTVFVVSGLWHGAAYAFLIWGGLHGLGMVLERFIYGEKLKKMSNLLSVSNILRLLVTFAFVNFAWIPFRVNNMSDIVTIFSKIFSNVGSLYIDVNTLSMAVIALLLVLLKDISDEYGWKISLLKSTNRPIKYLTFVLLVCYVLAFGVLNGGSFIYFQF